MILFLDKSADSINILIAEKSSRIVKKIFKKGSGNLLVLINKILVNTKNVQLNGIVAVSGPDTFSLSRSNIAIANALAFAKNIFIIGINRGEFSSEKSLINIGLKKIQKIKRGKFIKPFYDKNPNIIIKK